MLPSVVPFGLILQAAAKNCNETIPTWKQEIRDDLLLFCLLRMTLSPTVFIQYN
jgi:hypothetical protein